ncbi:MAG: SHOCT domain-containing protein [Reichenbachiella sp.]
MNAISQDSFSKEEVINNMITISVNDNVSADGMRIELLINNKTNNYVVIDSANINYNMEVDDGNRNKSVDLKSIVLEPNGSFKKTNHFNDDFIFKGAFFGISSYSHNFDPFIVDPDKIKSKLSKEGFKAPSASSVSITDVGTFNFSEAEGEISGNFSNTSNISQVAFMYCMAYSPEIKRGHVYYTMIAAFKTKPGKSRKLNGSSRLSNDSFIDKEQLLLPYFILSGESLKSMKYRSLINEEEGIMTSKGGVSTTFTLVSNRDGVTKEFTWSDSEMSLYAFITRDGAGIPQADKTASTSNDAMDRLEKLKVLHEKGLITDEEYNEKRKEIMDTL